LSAAAGNADDVEMRGGVVIVDGHDDLAGFDLVGRDSRSARIERKTCAVGAALKSHLEGGTGFRVGYCFEDHDLAGGQRGQIVSFTIAAVRLPEVDVVKGSVSIGDSVERFAGFKVVDRLGVLRDMAGVNDIVAAVVEVCFKWGRHYCPSF
jgi:hypothetical protein